MIVRRLLLFICLYISLLPSYSNNLVKKIYITYSHIDGYAVYKSTAVYKAKENFFVLKNKKNTHNSKHLPERFPQDVISVFISDITSPDADTCSFYHISMSDLDNYKKLVHEICSNEDYFDVILSSKINEEDYLLLCNNRLPTLSCHEIMKLLSTPCILFPSEKPLMKIVIVMSDGSRKIITPSSCYEGQPWVVNDAQKINLVNASKVMTLLEKIGFNIFLYLQERSLLVLHVANKLINNQDGDYENSSVPPGTNE